MPPGPGIACGDCDEHMRRNFGCPVFRGHPWAGGSGEGWKEKATSVFRPCNQDPVKEGDEPGWMRTCPQYYARSPFVLGILDDLGDYEANRLGNVFDLPGPYLVYLRVASAERKSWAAWWTA